MSVELSDIGEAARRLLTGRHPCVYNACPAELNGEKGFLGLSRGVYWKVWFDTDSRSKTLFTSFMRVPAEAKFKELRRSYGK
jgi:hypothetical protein